MGRAQVILLEGRQDGVSRVVVKNLQWRGRPFAFAHIVPMSFGRVTYSKESKIPEIYIPGIFCI